MKGEERIIDEGFAPILGVNPKVLILGTLPSVKSLEHQQYYGNPQNAFWWSMSELLSFDLSISYIERVELVKQNSIAIWDVIERCHRPGSLDSRIDQSTLVANDFSSLLSEVSTIKLVAFNGQAASKLFNKYVSVDKWNGEFMTLPSTSPANAAMKKQDKLEHWREVLTYLE